ASTKGIPRRKLSRMTPSRTIPSIVATPKRMINPIPAEIPKTVPVTHKDINPPTNANGIVIAEISVSLIVPKLKYNRNKISNSTAGTITTSCAVARSLHSNSPAQTTLLASGMFVFSATLAFASAIVLPKSLPSILNPTAMYRLNLPNVTIGVKYFPKSSNSEDRPFQKYEQIQFVLKNDKIIKVYYQM